MHQWVVGTRSDSCFLGEQEGWYWVFALGLRSVLCKPLAPSSASCSLLSVPPRLLVLWECCELPCPSSAGQESLLGAQAARGVFSSSSGQVEQQCVLFQLQGWAASQRVGNFVRAAGVFQDTLNCQAGSALGWTLCSRRDWLQDGEGGTSTVRIKNTQRS